VAGDVVWFVSPNIRSAAPPRRTKFALSCLNFERPLRKQMADAVSAGVFRLVSWLEAAGTFDENLHSRR
jgi:hypothetical protein